MAAGFNQAARAAFNLARDKATDFFTDVKSAPPTSASRPDPLSMAESARMRSLAHTRELMSRRTR